MTELNPNEGISTNQIIMEPITVPYYAVYSYVQEYLNEKNKVWYNGNEIVRHNRYNIYEMDDGTQVKITEVSQDPNLPADHKRRFPDSVYLGTVVKWVKTVHW
tara:strand:- start:322 stop:630 length:309 start_codon:yes stop_codon:yes gene_type:complete